MPAIPNPLRTNRPNKRGTLENEAKMMTAKGAKNSANIKMVLKTIVLLPYLLIWLILKYSDTRNLSVEEKSESTDLGNVKCLIKIILSKTYFNKGGNWTVKSFRS